MLDLTDTRELELIAKSIAEKFGCGISPDEQREHSKLLAVLPERIDTVIHNQEKILNSYEEYLLKVRTIEMNQKTNHNRLTNLETSVDALATRVTDCEQNISKIFVGRKIFFWTLGVVLSIITVLADWIFRMLGGSK
jgi:hypothetical protein